MLSLLTLLGAFSSAVFVAGSEKPEFLDHAGAAGTQHGRARDDPDFYTTNSYIPLLPRLNGFMGSHGTYRFMSIVEQTMVAIGEPKHGLWRGQESGFIREYRKAGMTGLEDGVDANDWDNLEDYQQDIIEKNYASFLPGEGYAGYKYPDQRVAAGVLNFIDLTIYHPKYGGKYENHTAIDLPHFACTMSGPNYRHIDHVWKFAMAQPKANTFGPLGRRAGLDIEELYTNVVQLHLFGDASVWANVGVGNATTDQKISNINETKTRGPQTIDYHVVDTFTHMDYEIYLFERPFFNVPYLFVTVVMENKNETNPEFAYLRPDGLYWDNLVKRGLGVGVSNTEKYNLKVYLEEDVNGEQRTVYGLPFYGLHHPNRTHFGLYGGACPERGGDFGRYPWGNPGGWWPTMLQEITPFCDGLLVDIRMWANLWNTFWTDKSIGVGNAYSYDHVVPFYAPANVYGDYTDPYLANKTNPDRMVLTSDGQPVTNWTEGGTENVIIPLRFEHLGEFLDFVPVPGLEALDETRRSSCGAAEKPPPPPAVEPSNDMNEIPTWALAMLILESVLLFLVIIFAIICIIVSKKSNKVA